MALLTKGVSFLIKSNILGQCCRQISIFPQLRLKEIHQREEGNTTIIEGKYVPSPREPYLIKSLNNQSEACPLCKLGLDVKHTDVLILSQFVRSDGCMLPRRITGLCKKEQKKMSTLVAMAQKAGLMSMLTPPNSKKDPMLRRKWKKYNTYFDENTIKWK